MKRCIFIISVCCAYSYAMAQHSNLEKIKDYSYSMSKKNIVDSLTNSLIEEQIAYIERDKEDNRESLIFYEDNIRYFENCRLKLQSDSSTIIQFTLGLKNAEEYTFKKNIYDFIIIDSSRIQIVHYNRQKKEIISSDASWFYTWSFTNRYWERKDWFNLTNALSVIEKEEPDVWLTEGWIFRDFNWEKNGNTNYLFLKNDKIYVYRSKYQKMYELNDFIHKFFREKKFKKRAILDERLRNEGCELIGN